ncbi:hypothetical protein ACFE04_018508 [Oxalis oulophora]
MLGFTISSSWWLTPTYLFLFLNIVIATIVLITRSSSHRNPDQQLGRVPAVIDRVKSFNYFSHSTDRQHQPSTTEHDYGSATRSPQLARVPSLLDRVKSINFSHYKFPSFNAETEFVDSENDNRVDSARNPPQLARVPSFLDRVKSIDFSLYKFQSTELVEPEIGNRVDSDDSAMVDRVKSNISLYLSSGSKDRTEPDPDDYSDMGHRVHVKRTKSEQNGTRLEKGWLPDRMMKSASEKFGFGSKPDKEEDYEVERRRPQTVKVEKTATFGEGTGDVDVKADDFINRFKQQLKLQRLDSLLRYRGK